MYDVQWLISLSSKGSDSSFIKGWEPRIYTDKCHVNMDAKLKLKLIERGTVTA